MNTNYLIKVTITGTHIISETVVGSEVITDVIPRGITEDVELGNTVIKNKQRADVVLETDTAERRLIRVSYNKTKE